MFAITKKIPKQSLQWYVGLDYTQRKEPQLSAKRPVKVQVVFAGICGTDVGIYQGKDSLALAMKNNPGHDVILGHEFCGKIVELHDSAREYVAQLLFRRKNTRREVLDFLSQKTIQQVAQDPALVEFLNKNFYVSAEMHFTCGECLQCRIGDEHVCKKVIGKGLHEDGAFTNFMVLPANRLLLFEQGEIAPEIISFMDALGNSVHMAQSADLVGRNVLITGAGVQGLMSTAVVRNFGVSKIFVTDVIQKKTLSYSAVDKLTIAKKLGADFVFDVSSEEGRKILKETIARETDNTGVDVVFEMSGHYGAYQQAFENIRMGGTLLLLGLPAGKLSVDFSTDVVFRGLTIRGIYGRRVFDTWNLMRYLLAKKLGKVIMESGIITHQLPLKEFDRGFQALLHGEAVKVLLKP